MLRLATLFPLLLSAVPVFAEEEPGPQRAVAHLAPTKGHAVSGSVTFTPQARGVTVNAEISGLPVGKHGFHIHEFGDCSAPDAASAGDHFNPFGRRHGAPQDEERHAGDFGNITANEDGHATLTVSSEYLAFDGPGGLLGRSVVVHANEDDLKSQPTGAAGARLACGIIGVAK